MRKPEFTPSSWNSEDGTWTFYMGKSGAIDILPGPNHRFMQWAKYQDKVPVSLMKRPPREEGGHIHI